MDKRVGEMVNAIFSPCWARVGLAGENLAKIGEVLINY